MWIRVSCYLFASTNETFCISTCYTDVGKIQMIAHKSKHLSICLTHSSSTEALEKETHHNATRIFAFRCLLPRRFDLSSHMVHYPANKRAAPLGFLSKTMIFNGLRAMRNKQLCRSFSRTRSLHIPQRFCTASVVVRIC